MSSSGPPFAPDARMGRGALRYFGRLGATCVVQLIAAHALGVRGMEIAISAYRGPVTPWHLSGGLALFGFALVPFWVCVRGSCMRTQARWFALA